MCEIGDVRAEVEFFPLALDEQPAPTADAAVEPVIVEQPAATPVPVR